MKITEAPPFLNARWAALVASGLAWWCPGMVGRLQTPSGLRVVCYVADGPRWVTTTGLTVCTQEVDPDWTDPATLGCLLDRVEVTL